MTEGRFTKFPSIFVRLTGRSGCVREYQALIDVGSDYCILPQVDALTLGYPEAIEELRTAPADNVTTFAAHQGYGQAIRIRMNRVDVGKNSFEGVEFLALDLPQVTRFDVVLGESLLKFVALKIDYSTKLIHLERGGPDE